MEKIKIFFAENKFIFIAFLLPAALVILALAVTEVFPFGEKQIAVIDMYHQYVPFLSELQYKLQNGGSLFYTWNGAGGSNFWNLLAYYGASPLNLLLALFPAKFIMEGVTTVLLIKIGLAGNFMAIYLRYESGRCDMVTVAFSTLYALSSYVMAYYWCIMWMDAVTLLPLCMLGLNRIIDDGRAVLYTVSLALVVFTNYYVAIMVCIFILCYYPVLYFLKIRGSSVRMCAGITGKAVGYSFLGIGMAAVMLLPTYISMQDTYYISADMPENWSFYYDALDIVNQLLPNAELTFREGPPNLYCGMLVVILLTLYFSSELIALREKLLNGAFFVFLFLSLNVNKLNFIWHGFHFPNQLPYRYTFVICFLLICIAYRMFLKVDTFRIRTLWTVLAAGTGYYLMAQKLMEENIDDINLYFYSGVAWLAMYCGVMILYRKGYLTRQYFALVVVIVMAAEMGANACTSFDKIGNSFRTTYFENYEDVTKLAEKTKEEFVRAEMDYCYTLNGPALYHYRGLSQFSSSLNANSTALMEKIGLEGEPGKNRFNYNLTNPVTNAMLNVKYIIAKNLKMEDDDFEVVERSGHTRLYENKRPLSIGYMLGDEIRTWDVSGGNPYDVLNDYVRAATGNRYDKVFHSIGDPKITATNCNARQVADGDIKVTGAQKNGYSKVVLQYKAPETRKYYVFVEAANAGTIVVNKGHVVDDIDIMNDCGSIINIGEVKAGKTFKITIKYGKGKVGNIDSHVRYMDDETWQAAYDVISRDLLEVTDSGDTFLHGTIDVEERGVLVTSVPYEKGWRLKVDGQKREIRELTGDLWISTALDPGEHEIELSFRPPGFIAGIVISVMSIGLLCFFRIFGKRRRRSLFREEPEEMDFSGTPEEDQLLHEMGDLLEGDMDIIEDQKIDT